jgi:hypothetical protein
MMELAGSQVGMVVPERFGFGHRGHREVKSTSRCSATNPEK